ncbi:alkaline phosphatase [Microlunatus elymi]|uniref:Alkaline phosphatase n=1 Tax=Microlunatus elymi TaxID=2596828 RepID=A0A516Q1S8_9ACTN|nr:alkaline phosphatase D family protein [Microlunatus elymi]QDP97383.1 alkaline phosphatase [Microlunatus elymi]
MLTHGVQSGDVTSNSATIWTRADREARMLVEISRGPEFRRSQAIPGAWLRASSDFTGKTVINGLPSGTDLYYRVTPYGHGDHDRAGQQLTGHLRTAARDRRDISFVWSGDLGGQGWGIDVDRGGYRIFEQMRKLSPDFDICNGDNVYADDPIEATQLTHDGSVWHNLVTEEKSKPAETLTEYRGQYQYNLMDENLKAFYAEVAQIQQWDDHETHSNWYPGEILEDAEYTEKRVDVLKYRARQAYHEYTPINPRYDAEGRIYRTLHQGPLRDVFVLDMRWFRDANSPNRQTFNDGGILGLRQQRWLERELLQSRATWKVISNDMPLGEVVADGASDYEAVSNGDNGQPMGRELQIAEILRFIKRHKIKNVVWLTTDVHYTAAHYFDPDKAAFNDFDPFWQFTTGPLNAGSFPASPVDGTFGAQQVFVKSPPYANAAPDSEYQFFGEVKISGRSRELTVNLRDNSGTVLWSRDLAPQRSWSVGRSLSGSDSHQCWCESHPVMDECQLLTSANRRRTVSG